MWDLFVQVTPLMYMELFLSSRYANRSNSMKFLTQNDHLEEIQDGIIATPSTSPNCTLERKTDRIDGGTAEENKQTEPQQFYFPPGEAPPKDESSSEPEKVAASAQSTIRGEYYFQYAVNEGLGHLDKVDSSQLSLHTPSECDRVSIDGLREPPILFASPETTFPCDPNLSDSPFTRGPKRMSTRKNDRVFAWKLFNSQK